MSRNARALAGALCLAVLSAPLLRADAEAPKPDPSLKKEALADGIWLFRAPSALDLWTASNSVVIVNDEDVVVFDTNTRPATARMVIAEIRKLTKKPVRTVVNSHWHMDHWGGNDEYAKAFPGVRIVATEETRGYMSRMPWQFFAEETGYEKSKAALENAIRTGKRSDGVTPLTPELRKYFENDLEETRQFVEELKTTPRLLPDVAFRDALTFFSGGREFRLTSETGDATGSAVLYLPKEKILVTGDVLVSPADGNGPPPWTTNSYAITPWLATLRRLDALDATVIVPGQGPAMRDKAYLERTIALYASVIDQVHAALRRGVVTLTDVQAAVNADEIGKAYTKDGKLTADFPLWLKTLAKKVHQEAVDGAASTR